MLGTIIITIIIVGIFFLLLGFSVFFTKKGKFPNIHVEGNKALNEKGITCAKSQDKLSRKQKNLFDIIENTTKS